MYNILFAGITKVNTFKINLVLIIVLSFWGIFLVRHWPNLTENYNYVISNNFQDTQKTHNFIKNNHGSQIKVYNFSMYGQWRTNKMFQQKED